MDKEEWIKHRSREIYDSYKHNTKDLFDLEVLKTFTPNRCVCCGQTITYRGSGGRRFKQGHHTKYKWILVKEQAEREYNASVA